jgi:hypothetical protein
VEYSLSVELSLVDIAFGILVGFGAGRGLRFQLCYLSMELIRSPVCLHSQFSLSGTSFRVTSIARGGDRSRVRLCSVGQTTPALLSIDR